MSDTISIYKGDNHRECDIDEAKKSFAQYLQTENLNFLIGCGCSSNVEDGKELAIPIMNGLYKSFFEGNPDFDIAGIDPKDRFDNNLESMLDTMLSIKMTNYLVKTDERIDEKIKAVQKHIVDKIINGQNCKSVLDYYKSFYLKLVQPSRRQPINIFTTNYDLFNEQALDSLGFYAKNKNELLLKPVYNHIPLFDRIQSYLDEGKSWKYTSIITKLEGKVLLKRDEKHDMNFYGYTTLETQSISSYAKENGISEQDVYNRYADKIFRTTNAQSSVRQTVIKETKGFEYPMFSCEYVPIKGKNEGKKIEILYKSGSTDDQRNMVMFLSDVVKKIDGVYYYLDKVSSLWDDIDYNNLTKEGDIEFANGKKPIKLLQRIINLATEDDSYILDFFSGSASTAHAVVQQNLEDNGTRKFIMVQIPEETDAKSNARKAGFRTICEIGKERIRRAGQKIRNEQLGIKNEGDNSSLQTPNSSLDTGFRVLKCDSSNMKDVYYNPAEYEPSLFSSLEDNIKEDRTPEDLLFQVMLDLGILLSSKIQVRSEKVGMRNYSYFDVEDGYLIACFDKNIDEEVITAIAKQKPYYFVMRDSSMANDSVATNFEQIFAAYSPDTVRKVL